MPPRQLAVAVSLFRARQADSGQNEGKEFGEESFFGITRNKGAWFGYKEKKLEFGTVAAHGCFFHSLWSSEVVRDP